MDNGNTVEEVGHFGVVTSEKDPDTECECPAVD